jgi:hypothetical protein
MQHDAADMETLLSSSDTDTQSHLSSSQPFKTNEPSQTMAEDLHLANRANPPTLVTIDPFEPIRKSFTFRRDSFVGHFVVTPGPLQIVALAILLAFGAGSTIGVVRQAHFA